jgi:isopentenyldiphosphate isomerase
MLIALRASKEMSRQWEQCWPVVEYTSTPFVLEPDEVCDARWVTQVEIHALVHAAEMISYDATYLRAVFDCKPFEEMLISTP